MNLFRDKARLSGVIILCGFIAGILSIVPAVDSINFLTEASSNSTQVRIAVLFQFILSICYLGFAILIYPIIKKFYPGLAIGFLSFRVIAGGILIMGAILLLSILILSQEFSGHNSENSLIFQAIGNVLKVTRDYINHIFMVLALGAGNLLLYVLFLRTKLIPTWLSIWGILGILPAIFASVLLLFHQIEVITPQYLVLNMPTALFELVLGFWLIVKGFTKIVNQGSELLDR